MNKTLEKLKEYIESGAYKHSSPIIGKEEVECCIKALETNIELNKRKMTSEIIKEYMIFEDECIQKDFTFKSLLEAREKQIPKKPVGEWYLLACPICNGVVDEHECNYKFDYCLNCGQKIDWSEADD